MSGLVRFEAAVRVLARKVGGTIPPTEGYCSVGSNLAAATREYLAELPAKP